jgi:hypothetical protein
LKPQLLIQQLLATGDKFHLLGTCHPLSYQPA